MVLTLLDSDYASEWTVSAPATASLVNFTRAVNQLGFFTSILKQIRPVSFPAFIKKPILQ
jgi:hypothetical protein